MERPEFNEIKDYDEFCKYYWYREELIKICKEHGIKASGSLEEQMSKVFIMCGKLCSGKSTYAKRIRKAQNAVVLSIDEVMLSVFGQDAGEKHDYYVERIKEYQYAKSVEIAETGINVVLDWGFWTKKERDYAKEFYSSRNIDYEFYYLNVDPDEWNRRIQKRNQDVLNHESDTYYVDEGLAEKFESIFEVPTKDEIDVWVNS